MNSNVPRIAIPEPTSSDAAYNERSMPQYIRAVEAAGGVAIPIFLQDSQAVQARTLTSCSAILLPGSPADVDPARYGQQAVEACAAKDALREAADNLLLRDAFAQRKPILGICYGLQSLNVFRGGSLIQDLTPASAPAVSEVGSPVNHEPGREVQDAHPVIVTPGSRLSQMVPRGRVEAQGLTVNSSHHQAVDSPGKLLMIAAVSPQDGVIEALEGTQPGQFVVAVQWHPERSYETSQASRVLFATFLEEAREWLSSPMTATGPGQP